VVRRGALAVTRRRASYRSLRSLERDLGVCRACIEAGPPLESLPVLAPGAEQRAYMFGQAPGAVEGAERRPWRGRAGVTLRRWFAMDEDEFYATFYCASVTRCYPGRAPSGRGDRTPTPREQALCEFWRDWELALLRPRLIVTVGGVAVKRLLGLSGLADCVGHRFERDGAVVVPVRAAITTTLGGLRVGSDARAAPGVWAAGADAGGIATGGYASGLAAALVLGRVAAASALAGHPASTLA
jgi:uracil-DNA glycosylase family 4